MFEGLHAPSGLVFLALTLFLAALLLVPFLYRRRSFLRISFTLTAAASLAACVGGIWGVGQGGTESWILAIGLPDLPFHLRLDPLSNFFLTVIGLLGFYVSIYSIGYCEALDEKHSSARLVVFYVLFLLGMFLVVLADDAFFFLISWELMAAASYCLVMFEDERPAHRRAAYLYLVVAHVGAIAILLSFGVLSGAALPGDPEGSLLSGYTFDAMRETHLSPGWAAAAFLLAFFGFAAKAGVVPFHVWLPEAHPVAPSNVSALMSGVMLKTAIYGIVRVSFDLLDGFPWWWGGLVLALGLVSAVLGVLYALMQHDLKRLLAYHSVENIGIILIGIGLAMIFTARDFPVLAALALTAGLYHTLNHAVFKGLLFMGAGAVLHATHQRNMEEMGGLIHRLPWTAALFLIGCISISALPPFNGFVSEWLTFQAFLLSPSLEAPMLNLIIPLGATLLALTGALAAACFVKAFGVTFLGHWRGHHQPHFREVPWSMRIGMLLPAASCLILGILPTAFIQWMDVLSEDLVGGKISLSAGAFGWLWLTPVSHERASYSGAIVFAGVIAVVFLVYLFLHARKTALHRGPAWDCGFEKITPRMQYTATSFSMPIRRIFGFLFQVQEQVRKTGPSRPAGYPPQWIYRLRVRDRFWGWLYQPAIDGSIWVSRMVGKLQQGRIQVYLVYSFVTIIILLLISR
jgi:formate hydrogenlyase subunit 3/multisubunit Na+/H+ antiporter MnhD subunit